MVDDPRLQDDNTTESILVALLLLDSSIRHQIYVLRYANSIAKNALNRLKVIESELLSVLQDRLDTIDQRGFDLSSRNTSRLNSLLSELNQIITSGYVGIRTFTEASMLELAGIEVESAVKRLQDAFQAEINVFRANNKNISEMVKTNPIRSKTIEQYFDELSSMHFKRLRDVLVTGIIDGVSTQEIIKQVRGTRSASYMDSVLFRNRHYLETVIRTIVSHISARATELVFQENNDLVRAVKWVSVLDERTTAICRSRDGNIYKINEGPRPPAHPNCRSTIMPVLYKFDDMTNLKRGRGARDYRTILERELRDRGFTTQQIAHAVTRQRRAMTGTVPADLTYGAWLKRQPREFIEGVLGKKKADLFLSGRMTLDKFVDENSGKEISLRDLQSR